MRRSTTERISIETAYDMGRGAYYAKHVCRQETRMLMLKNWYWLTDFWSKAGLRRLSRELYGAAIYLWNLRGSRNCA